jgi:hypothetical protein
MISIVANLPALSYGIDHNIRELFAAERQASAAADSRSDAGA